MHERVLPSAAVAYNPPMRLPRFVVGWFLFFLCLFLGLFGVHRQLFPFDEGFVLCAADRILHGELPYRDFIAVYPPGQYYIVAWLFAIFGPGTLVMRLYDICVKAALVGLLGDWIARTAGQAMAMATGVIAALWLMALPSFGYSSFPSLLLSLTLILDRAQADDATPTSRCVWALAAGILSGGATVIRHDLGAYGVMSALVALASRPPGRAADRRLLPVASFLGGVALVVIPVAAWLILNVSPQALLFDLYTYPVHMHPRVRRRPLQAEFALPYFFPLAVYALTACALGLARQRKMWTAIHSRILTFLVLGVLIFNLARIRVDSFHLAPTLLVGFAAAATLARAFMIERRRLWYGAVALGLLTVMSLTLVRPLRKVSWMLREKRPFEFTVRTRTPRSPYISVQGGIEKSAFFIREHTTPEERIFVGCGRHDRIARNEPIVYFLAERLPATKYHFLEPGIATTRDGQAEITAGLERYRVKYLALSTAADDVSEPNESAISSGVFVLDNYIHSRYRLIRQFGPYNSVWERLDSSSRR
jgi:hypothetical protein